MKNILKVLLCGFVSLGLVACSSNEPEQGTKEKKDEITFEEITLVDNEYATFTIKSISDDGDFLMKVGLENKSDMTLMYSVEGVYVNGVLEDPYWATEVTAGNKANDTISFYENNLKEDGITSVTKLSFMLNIYDSNDWEKEHIVQEEFTIYPYGEDKAKDYIREAKDTDIVFVDNNDISIILDSVLENDFEYTLKFYIDNKTNKNVMVSIDGASVNGYMCDPYWACAINKNGKAYCKVCWYKNALEENDIEKVEEISMPFSVYDYDNFEADDILNETFTYKAKE